MATTLDRILSPLGGMCRLGASALIAGVWRRRSLGEVDDRLRALPVREQATIVAAVMAALLVLGIFAAQFGLIGFFAYLLAVILIVN
jgi:hypothetical protein